MIGAFRSSMQVFGQTPEIQRIQHQLDSVKDIFYLPGSVMPAIEDYSIGNYIRLVTLITDN